MLEAFLEILLSFFGFSFVHMITNAAKHGLAEDKRFDRKIFMKTNLKPALWSFAGGVLIALLAIFVPEQQLFVEIIAEGEVDVKNMWALHASGVLAGGVLKFYFGKPTKVVEQEMNL